MQGQILNFWAKLNKGIFRVLQFLGTNTVNKYIKVIQLFIAPRTSFFQ